VPEIPSKIDPAILQRANKVLISNINAGILDTPTKTYNHRQKVPERRRFYSLKTVFAPSTTPSIWIFTSSGESSSITKVFTQTYFNWRIFPAPLTEWQGFEVVDLGIDN